MHAHRRTQRSASILAEKKIKNAEKAGEGFAAAGGRSEQDRFAFENRGNAAQLRVGEVGKGRAEPARETRMKPT